MPKRLCILGSTGSIGTSTLDIVALHPDQFDVTILAAANSVERLAHQIIQFQPKMAVLFDEKRVDHLKALLGETDEGRGALSALEIVWGSDGYRLAAAHPDVDAVLLAMVGAAGLMPALAAIDAGKQIALANKETLVMAGELVMARAKERDVTIYPVDSEHSAIFQCLEGNRRGDLKKIFLTASGGPFRKTPLDRFPHIQPDDALNHPTWAMGHKITIDSATLMNKALEVVEAVHLFSLTEDQVEVVVHPQSIVHSMVGFTDGAIMAQMGLPDMRSAISYALSWPQRLDLQLDFPDFPGLHQLEFEAPDGERFPSLGFARAVCRAGGTLPAVMNAANEIAVQAFLDHQIDFPGIFDLIEKIMGEHHHIASPNLDQIIEADGWAREAALSSI